MQQKQNKKTHFEIHSDFVLALQEALVGNSISQPSLAAG